MISIKSIIDTLNPTEKQLFVLHLKQKNKRHNTKNVQLFQLLNQGESQSETICKALYNSTNRNAYHALRKRLIDSLIDFIANKNLEDENSIDMQVIKYTLAARTFLLQKNYATAYKLLDKAEQIASNHLLFPILNEIYHTKIQYASYYSPVNLNELIQKQNLNREKHVLEDQLNIVYAKLKTALNAVNHKEQTVNFEATLNNVLNDTNIKLSKSLSFKSLYQILAIADISAFVTTKYYEIEDFVLKTYAVLKNKPNADRQLYYQIHIVYIISNTLFRNRKFEDSMFYITEMEQLMRSKNKMHYKDFILKHHLVKALNLNFTNKANDAIALIKTVMQKKYAHTETYLDLQLTLLMFYIQQENFSEAKSVLSKFYHTDQWYIRKTGVDWLIKKNIAELLLYIELEEDNLFYSRLKSFKRNYSNYAKQINQERILIFLKFAEQYYSNNQIIKTTDFKAKIKTTFEWTTVKREDIFVLSFYAWLKSKVDNTSIYATTLKLIST